MRTGSWSERIFLLFLLGLVCNGLLLVVQRRLPQLGNGGLVQLAFDFGGGAEGQRPVGDHRVLRHQRPGADETIAAHLRAVEYEQRNGPIEFPTDEE